MVGCAIPTFAHSMDAIASTAPAADIKCPIIDFVELIGILKAPSPKTALIACVSAGSFFGVDVPWALIYVISDAESPAIFNAVNIARLAPRPSGSGSLME